jgi:hypothetical protein
MWQCAGGAWGLHAAKAGPLRPTPHLYHHRTQSLYSMTYLWFTYDSSLLSSFKTQIIRFFRVMCSGAGPAATVLAMVEESFRCACYVYI